MRNFSLIGFVFQAVCLMGAEDSLHRIYAGKNLQMATLINRSSKLQAKGKGTFYGSQLGYEYQRKNDLILSLSLFFANTTKPVVFKDKTEETIFQIKPGMFDFYLNIGKSKSLKKVDLGFYTGTGIWGVLSGSKNFDELSVYIPVGLKLTSSLLSFLDCGVDVQVLGNAGVKTYLENRETVSSNFKRFLGGKVSFPVRAYLGAEKQGDFLLEPYIHLVSFSEREHFYGAKLQASIYF